MDDDLHVAQKQQPCQHAGREYLVLLTALDDVNGLPIIGPPAQAALAAEPTNSQKGPKSSRAWTWAEEVSA